jgi:hypothetical protein
VQRWEKVKAKAEGIAASSELTPGQKLKDIQQLFVLFLFFFFHSAFLMVSDLFNQLFFMLSYRVNKFFK